MGSRVGTYIEFVQRAPTEAREGRVCTTRRDTRTEQNNNFERTRQDAPPFWGPPPTASAFDFDWGLKTEVLLSSEDNPTFYRNMQ